MKRVLGKLLSVKSIVTLVMTACLAALLLTGINPEKDVLALFCTSYGAIITYFFTRQEKDEGGNGNEKSMS